MNDLEYILKAYAAFEFDVRGFSSQLWFPWCSNCRKVCCQAVYCRETFESPFFILLIEACCGRLSAGPEKSWLGSTGCRLPVGRPPVCYEFLCADILDDRRPALQRYAMTVLSRLIDHIGKKALGSRHLVEIMNPADLRKIRYSRFQKRLIEARVAFGGVQSVFSGDRADPATLKILGKIVGPQLSTK